MNVTRDELNGLGTRINEMSTILAKTEERSETNEKNIDKLIKHTDALLWKVAFMMMVPMIGIFVKEFL